MDVWQPGIDLRPPQNVVAADVPALHPPTKLLTLAFDTLKADILGWAMAGLGLTLPILGLTFLIFGVVMAAMIPGLVMKDEAIASVGVLVGFALLTVVVLPVALVIMPVLQASLTRSIEDRITQGTPLGFSASFRTWRENLWDVIVVNLLVAAFTMVGLMFCYLPGLVVALALCFAPPLVALRGVRPMDAIAMSFNHFKAHPGWATKFLLLGVLVMIVISYLPIVGYLFSIPFYVAYLVLGVRSAFADLPTPSPEGS